LRRHFRGLWLVVWIAGVGMQALGYFLLAFRKLIAEPGVLRSDQAQFRTSVLMVMGGVGIALLAGLVFDHLREDREDPPGTAVTTISILLAIVWSLVCVLIYGVWYEVDLRRIVF